MLILGDVLNTGDEIGDLLQHFHLLKYYFLGIGD